MKKTGSVIRSEKKVKQSRHQVTQPWGGWVRRCPGLDPEPVSVRGAQLRDFFRSDHKGFQTRQSPNLGFTELL